MSEYMSGLSYDEKMDLEASNHRRYLRVASRARNIRNVLTGGAAALAATVTSDKIFGDFLHNTGETVTSVALGGALAGAALAHTIKRNRENADIELMDDVFAASDELKMLPPAWVFGKESYVASYSPGNTSQEVVLAANH